MCQINFVLTMRKHQGEGHNKPSWFSYPCRDVLIISDFISGPSPTYPCPLGLFSRVEDGFHPDRVLWVRLGEVNNRELVFKILSHVSDLKVKIGAFVLSSSFKRFRNYSLTVWLIQKWEWSLTSVVGDYINTMKMTLDFNFDLYQVVKHYG